MSSFLDFDPIQFANNIKIKKVKVDQYSENEIKTPPEDFQERNRSENFITIIRHFPHPYICVHCQEITPDKWREFFKELKLKCCDIRRICAYQQLPPDFIESSLELLTNAYINRRAAFDPKYIVGQFNKGLIFVRCPFSNLIITEKQILL